MKLLFGRVLSLAILCPLSVSLLAQSKSAATKWERRSATIEELQAVLPSRAPVEKERIETEMQTATGVINARGQVIAAVVLIAAGYAANGKYSYYRLAQRSLRIGANIELSPGSYVIRWTRTPGGLQVRFYEAETGIERGTITAHPLTQPLPIISVKIWPPDEHSILQIGPFALPYSVGD